jgi:hypothetical protein
MADPFTLAVTLPPFLFDSNKSMALAPVVSATYAPPDFEKKLNKQVHLLGLESINRAVMSGKNVAETVTDVTDKIDAYHKGNMERFKDSAKAVPILGMDSTLKSATQKHMAKSKE